MSHTLRVSPTLCAFVAIVASAACSSSESGSNTSHAGTDAGTSDAASGAGGSQSGGSGGSAGAAKGGANAGGGGASAGGGGATNASGGSSGSAGAGGASSGGMTGAGGMNVGTGGSTPVDPKCAAADSQGFFASCSSCLDPSNCDTVSVGGPTKYYCGCDVDSDCPCGFSCGCVEVAPNINTCGVCMR